jgi:ubiquinone/menaquinone biosynthesis C-methylase UbiE
MSHASRAIASGQVPARADARQSGASANGEGRFEWRTLLGQLMPKSARAADEHRADKRIKEAEVFRAEVLKEMDRPDQQIRLLEFGCGHGVQAEVLSSLGRTFMMDVEISESLKDRGSVVQADARSIPFRSGQFDVVYSNHVMEHVQDPEMALAELLRVGTDDCLYLVSVPTPLWLLLSVPAQYLNKAKVILDPARWTRARGDRSSPRVELVSEDRQHKWLRRLAWAFLPTSHGIERGFLSCFRQFRRSRWRSLFRRHGFREIRTVPLLLYGPSEWPIVPTIVAPSARLCSSRLFVLRSQVT